MPRLKNIKQFLNPKTVTEAKSIQKELQKKLCFQPLPKAPRYVAGADAAFTDDEVIGVASLFSFPELTLCEESLARKKSYFRYRTGFLAFREGAAIIEALDRLHCLPDLILFDGQGIAHPRQMGIASFIGVLLDTPAIGCAKSRLIGEYDEPGPHRGDWSPLKYRGKTVGAVLRTKDFVRPLFVSPGHRIDLQSSIDLALKCTTIYRIPEPLRRADILSHKIKKGTVPFFDGIIKTSLKGAH